MANKDIRLHAIQPDSGYYTGARFESAGFISHLFFLGNDFFSRNYTGKRDPAAPDQVCGQDSGRFFSWSPRKGNDIVQERKMNEPQLIFEEIPELTQLSDFAWKCAKNHILHREGIPQSPYMDEGFDPTQIWIWDTCFMSLYCKYDPQEYPGIESLRNFYAPMLKNAPTSLGIRIPDNPPLFAWAELENYRMTGDRAHLEEIFFVRHYPQKMYELFENFHYGDHPSYMTSNAPVQWEKSGPGYHWSGGRCGMDNTPRGGFGAEIMDNDPAYRSILFLDAIEPAIKYLTN